MKIEPILADANLREVTRLCHFTASRHLPSIFQLGGLVPRSQLEEMNAPFHANDSFRLDGSPDATCCTVEYPNVWFLRQAVAKHVNFHDWVTALLPPKYLADESTLFCHRNAAAGAGSLRRPGLDGFRGMYAESVVGSGDRSYSRGAARLAACPTDNQAEVQIFAKVPLTDLLGVVVRDKVQARREWSRLTLAGERPERIKWVVCPEFFDAHALKRAIESGVRPVELTWSP